GRGVRRAEEVELRVVVRRNSGRNAGAGRVAEERGVAAVAAGEVGLLEDLRAGLAGAVGVEDADRRAERAEVLARGGRLGRAGEGGRAEPGDGTDAHPSLGRRVAKRRRVRNPAVVAELLRRRDRGEERVDGDAARVD